MSKIKSVTSIFNVKKFSLGSKLLYKSIYQVRKFNKNQINEIFNKK